MVDATPIIRGEAIGVNERLPHKSYEEITGKVDTPIYEYAISSWLYLDAQGSESSSHENSDAILINFGGKPAVTYNNKERIFKVTMDANEDGEIISKEVYVGNGNIPLQKWNHLVINVDSKGVTDVILNGEVVGSERNIIPITSYDTIETGMMDGILGGVKYLDFYNSKLSTGFIQ